MSPIAITLIVLLAAVVLFVWNRFPVGIVAIAVALALSVTGVLTFSEALAGFGDPVIVFIAALFVVSEALDVTGITTWAGQKLLARAGTSRGRLVTLVVLLVAIASALISVNGAVAALLPMVVVLALRTSRPSSQLLMPLAFGAHAGSLLALTGSPVNVLVSELAVEHGLAPFSFLSYALVGLPLVAGTLVIILVLGPRLLPDRFSRNVARDLSGHADTLSRQYSLDDAAGLLTHREGVTEMIVPPRSPVVGETVFPGLVSESGDLVVVAVQRAGEDLPTAVLTPGDVVLLRGTWEALDARAQDPALLVIDTPEVVRRQTVAMGPKARLALIVLAGMVILLATGIVPPAIAALSAAAALIVLRVVTVSQAHRSISWTTLILVGGMIPLSTAIQSSGAADLMAKGLVTIVGDSSPYLLLLGIAIVTVVLGQLISNTATALIVAPIALALATETGISARPLLMAVAVAAAASFLTPVATPANTMVMGPGSYRFGDYWKLGLPLVGLFIAVATFIVPIFWHF